MLLLWLEKIKGDEIFVDACFDDLFVWTACPIVRLRVTVCRGK